MISRMNRSALLAMFLSLLWLAGAAMASFPLLATVAVLGLLSPACWAFARRSAPHARLLAAGLAVTGVAMGGFLLFLRLQASRGTWIFAVEMAVLAVGAALIPLLYAATFTGDIRDGP